MAFTLLFVSLSVIGICIADIVYNIYFHPLSNIPGPFLARISNLPSFYHTCKGNRHIWLWRCFEIYGEKVRITPNTVLFNTPSAYTAIYDAQSNTRRSNFYHIFPRNENDHNTLTTTDVQAHAQKRRLLKLAFTERSTKAASAFVERHVDRWNELWETQGNDGWSKAEDVAERLDFLIFDILGDLCFGKEFNTKEREQNDVKGIPKLITMYMRFQYRVSDYVAISFCVFDKI
jgi:cytochrome P450